LFYYSIEQLSEQGKCSAYVSYIGSDLTLLIHRSTLSSRITVYPTDVTAFSEYMCGVYRNRYMRSASGDGEVGLAWEHGIKWLTMYIGNQSAEYVKSWGPDMETEMEDGNANTPHMRLLLWKWLTSE
jgi:hypothetical protein